MFWNGMRLLKLGDILRGQKHFFKELVFNRVTCLLNHIISCAVTYYKAKINKAAVLFGSFIPIPANREHS
jgi:hypothetical protein